MITDPSGTPHTATRAWQILVVGTEPAFQSMVETNLKAARWQGRAFELRVVSLEEVPDLPAFEDVSDLSIAIVDLVETDLKIALEACQRLRQTCSPALRFLLRSPDGVRVPGEFLIEGFKVDACISKDDSDAGNLYRLMVQALQTSQNIHTLHSFALQVRDHALQSFVERYDAEVALVGDLEHDDGEDPPLPAPATAAEISESELAEQPNVRFTEEGTDVAAGPRITAPLADLAEAAIKAVFQERSLHAVERVNRNGVTWLATESGERWGLPPKTQLLPFFFHFRLGEHRTTVKGGVCYKVRAKSLTPDERLAFADEIALMVENWRLAYSARWIHEITVGEQAMQAQLYEQRISSMTSLVSGLAHEINTPLGVATTANSMMRGLVTEAADRIKRSAPLQDLMEDFSEATDLMEKNLKRVTALVKRFKQLSSDQMVDERTTTSLGDVVRDCVESMKPENGTRGIDVMIEPAGPVLPWTGYAEHLSRILINLMQNILRYAYPSTPGLVMIRLRETSNDESGLPYRIEVEDYGNGIAPDFLPRIFDPFVTSGRATGGTGLGLAICRTVCTELLKGQITCTSQLGKGTTFTIKLPREVPEADASTRRKADLM